MRLFSSSLGFFCFVIWIFFVQIKSYHHHTQTLLSCIGVYDVILGYWCRIMVFFFFTFCLWCHFLILLTLFSCFFIGLVLLCHLVVVIVPATLYFTATWCQLRRASYPAASSSSPFFFPCFLHSLISTSKVCFWLVSPSFFNVIWILELF